MPYDHPVLQHPLFAVYARAERVGAGYLVHRIEGSAGGLRIIACGRVLLGKLWRGVLEVRQEDVDVAFQLAYDLGVLVAARVVHDWQLQNVWLELPRKVCREVIGIGQSP